MFWCLTRLFAKSRLELMYWINVPWLILLSDQLERHECDLAWSHIFVTTTKLCRTILFCIGFLCRPRWFLQSFSVILVVLCSAKLREEIVGRRKRRGKRKVQYNFSWFSSRWKTKVESYVAPNVCVCVWEPGTPEVGNHTEPSDGEICLL